MYPLRGILIPFPPPQRIKMKKVAIYSLNEIMEIRFRLFNLIMHSFVIYFNKRSKYAHS